MIQGNFKYVSLIALSTTFAVCVVLIVLLVVTQRNDGESLGLLQTTSQSDGIFEGIEAIEEGGSFLASDIPQCAAQLIVEIRGSYELHDSTHGNSLSRLRQSSHSCRTFGFLLRDDAILSGGKCAEHAYSVNIPGVGIRTPKSQINVVSSSANQLKWLKINSTDAALTMKRKQPRSKMFFLKDGLPLSKITTALAWGDISIGMKCDGSLPLLSIRTVSTGNNLLGDLLNRSEAPLSNILHTLVLKKTDVSTMAEMSSGEEKWWVRKRDYLDLKAELDELKPNHIGPQGSLNVVEGLGFKALLEAEDPYNRTKTCIMIYYDKWKKLKEKKMEPFFDWMDYGSGKNYTIGRESRNCAWQVIKFDSSQLQKVEIEFEYNVHENTVRAAYVNSSLELPEDTDLLYIWGLDRKVYVAKEHEEEDLFRMKHVSFTQSGPLLMAGFLKIGLNSEVISINSDSGHYKPQVKNFNRFYHFLRSLGIPRDAIQWEKGTNYSDRDWSKMFL